MPCHGIHLRCYYQHFPWANKPTVLQGLRRMFYCNWDGEYGTKHLSFLIFMTWFIKPSWFLLLAAEKPGIPRVMVRHPLVPWKSLAPSLVTTCMAREVPTTGGRSVPCWKCPSGTFFFFFFNCHAVRWFPVMLEEFLCCRNYTNSRWLSFHFYLWALVCSYVTLGW